MDSGGVHSHVHKEHHPHNFGSQPEEHQHDHEKKSILKKVKGKAKKIKDTIKKHGHHDHEYHYEDQHIPDDHDLDEEDDDDDEMVEVPEVHGAPIYESAAIKSARPGQVENIGQSRGNFEGRSATVMGEEPHQEPRVVVVSPNTGSYQNRATDSARTFVGEEGNSWRRKVNLERPIGLVEDSHAPGTGPEPYNAPNYQTKAIDPTGAGAAEIDINPVQKSFARMNVHDEPKPKPELKVLPIAADNHHPSAGSHDQFSPESMSTNLNRFPENPQATAQIFYTTTKAEDQPLYESMEKPSNQGSYTDKISSATSAIADKAITAKNVVASKLGYGEIGDRDDKNKKRHEDRRSEEKPSNQSSYSDKITYEDHKSEDASTMSGTTAEYGKKIALSVTEKLAPVYGKIAGVGSAVKSKVSGTGSGPNTGTTNEAQSGVSMKDYLADKLRPGDEDRALSEVISEALYNRKEEPTKAPGDEKRTVTQAISDAVHKREEEPEKTEHRRLGKVTESEEVKRRLGTGEEKTNEGSEESYVNSPGKGVVDKLKDVVGSWFGKPEENQSFQDGEGISKNSGAEAGHASRGVGERRFQQ